MAAGNPSFGNRRRRLQTLREGEVILNNFYVYVLFRPWDGSPCYVGKGKGRRWRVHGYSHGCPHNSRLANIVKRAGGQLPRKKVAENLTEENAFEIERSWIAKIGRGDKGPLVNFTDGGEGTSGLVITQERREAISKRHKGKKISDPHRARLIDGCKNRTWTEESKNKIRLAKLGKRRDAETIRKMSAATKSAMTDPERKAAVADANRARVWTPEMRLAYSIRRRAEIAANPASRKFGWHIVHGSQ